MQMISGVLRQLMDMFSHNGFLKMTCEVGFFFFIIIQFNFKPGSVLHYGNHPLVCCCRAGVLNIWPWGQNWPAEDSSLAHWTPLDNIKEGDRL